MGSQEGVMRAAVDAEGTSTTQPEHELQPRDPEMVGAAPPDEKKGVVGKVKDVMGRRGRKKHDKEIKDGVAKDGVLQKIKAKASSKVGHGHEGGPARLLSMSSSSSLSSSDEEDIGTVGFAMDPTGPAVAGATLGRHNYTNAPTGPGANFSDLTLNENDHDALRRHKERALEFSKTSNPMYSKDAESPVTPSEDDASHCSPTRNSHLTPSDDAHGDHSHPYPSARDPHASNSEEASGVAGEHHGNESAKEEGVMQRMLNKVY